MQTMSDEHANTVNGARPERLYGAQTEAAVANFAISGERVPASLIRALAAIKAEAALANHELGVIDEPMSRAIHDAANDVAAGRHTDQFPVDIFQTGSGTSTNMNVNEVVAALASIRLGRDVHPNDDVNASQSTNDTFPSAIRIACLEQLTDELLPALGRVSSALDAKAIEFGTIVKAGRTHHMDATPILLGDEFAAYRDQIDAARDRLEQIAAELGALPIGGTATGNGLNAPVGFGAAVAARLSGRLDLELTETTSHFAAQGSQDTLVDLSARLRSAAVALIKIANDIRLLASGPRTGLGELRIAPLQKGSSIMPGKVNPVICEVVTQVGAQVIGNDATVAFAGTQGTLELNVYLPVIARNLLQSLKVLTGASKAFAGKCIERLEADRERCERNGELTLATAAVLNPVIGYDRATEVVQAAHESGRSLREELAERGLLDDPAVASALDLAAIARGSIDRS